MALTLALPITVGPDSSLTTLELDSPADVARSVAMLLATQIGERLAIAEYGISSPLGAPDVDEAELAQAIEQWEDRVDDIQIDQIVAVAIDGTTSDVVTVTLEVLGD